MNTLQITFGHSHHKNGALKLDRLNACFQFLEPKFGSLETDRLNGPLNCEAVSLTVFTTMFPREQQTSDNLIVKDYCFIIEIFDKFSFSGILRGCLSHLNEA